MSQPVQHVATATPHVNVDDLEVVDGRAYENLEGWIPELGGEADLKEALEKAFDYRGDISLTFKNGERVEAYIYNRQTGSGLADSYIQYFASNAPDKRKVSYAEIARIEFTGKDRAAGKQWEAWLKKYAEKKAAGETNIALHPEPLD
jgi:hypothetical protein